MKKFSKIAAFIFALSLSATVMTACGDSKDGKKSEPKSVEDIDEKDLEDALNKLDEETSKELATEKEEATEAETETTEPETEPTTAEKIKYEATEEIKNAALNSACVQIGDTVFRTGGYMTAAELVELCDGKFDVSAIKLDEYMPSDRAYYIISGIKDPRIEITLLLEKRRENYGEQVKISDAIVSDVTMKLFDGEHYSFKDGISSKSAAYLEDVVFLPKNMKLMDYDGMKAFLAQQGVAESESFFCESGEYIDRNNVIEFEFEGEENLNGDYPIMMYRFEYDSETLKGDYLRFIIL